MMTDTKPACSLFVAHLLILVLLIECSNAAADECSYLTSCSPLPKPLKNETININANCLNETHVTITWFWLQQRRPVLFNLEYTCYNVTNDEVGTHIFVDKTIPINSTNPILPIFQYGEADYCVISGCAVSTAGSCYANFSDSYTIASCQQSTVVPFSSSFPSATETYSHLSLNTNTLQITMSSTYFITTSLSTTSTRIITPTNSSTLMSTTVKSQTGESSSPTTFLQNESSESIVSAAVAVSLVILGALSSTAFCISCLAYKKHNKRDSKDVYYYTSDLSAAQELHEQCHLDLALDEVSFKGSVMTVVQGLEYEDHHQPGNETIYECPSMEECRVIIDPRTQTLHNFSSLDIDLPPPPCELDPVKELITYTSSTVPALPSYYTPNHKPAKSNLNNSKLTQSLIHTPYNYNRPRDLIISSPDNQHQQQLLSSDGSTATDCLLVQAELHNDYIVHCKCTDYRPDSTYDTSYCSSVSSGGYIMTHNLHDSKQNDLETICKWQGDGYIHEQIDCENVT